MKPMKPPIPYRPESLESLRARYRAALESVRDVRALALGDGPWPGRDPACVFDTEAGFRLIVSREDLGGRLGVKVHFSASLRPGSSWYDTLMDTARNRGARAATEALLDAAVQLYRQVSGFTGPIELVGLSEAKGVPHWYHEEAAYVPGEARS